MKLGNEVVEKVTGFKGILVGKCEYLTGCTQYAIQPKVGEDGSFKEIRWFDEGRLTVTGNGVAAEDVKSPENGADFPPPKM